MYPIWCPDEGGGGGGGAGAEFSPLLDVSPGSSLLPEGGGGSVVEAESKDVRFWALPGRFDEWWCINGPAGWK